MQNQHLPPAHVSKAKKDPEAANRGMSVKVYLVLTPCGDGEKVVDAKLTYSAAEGIASKTENAYIRKLTATK